MRFVAKARDVAGASRGREISGFARLGGGAGRTRTSEQSVIGEPNRAKGGDIFGTRRRLSTGLPAQEERACEIDRRVETSVSTPLSPALPGP